MPAPPFKNILAAYNAYARTDGTKVICMLHLHQLCFHLLLSINPRAVCEPTDFEPLVCGAFETSYTQDTDSLSWSPADKQNGLENVAAIVEGTGSIRHASSFGRQMHGKISNSASAT